MGQPVWRTGARLVGPAERLGRRHDRNPAPRSGPRPGCWGGRHSVWLASLGWQVTAVDVSAAGIEQGRRAADEASVPVDWVVADLRRWEPTAGATFNWF